MLIPIPSSLTKSYLRQLLSTHFHCQINKPHRHHNDHQHQYRSSMYFPRWLLWLLWLEWCSWSLLISSHSHRHHQWKSEGCFPKVKLLIWTSRLAHLLSCQWDLMWMHCVIIAYGLLLLLVHNIIFYSRETICYAWSLFPKLNFFRSIPPNL